MLVHGLQVAFREWHARGWREMVGPEGTAVSVA